MALVKSNVEHVVCTLRMADQTSPSSLALPEEFEIS